MNLPLTSQHLEVIRQRCNQATGDYWFSDKGKVFPADQNGFKGGPPLLRTQGVVWKGMDGYQPIQRIYDAEFAAHARSDVPKLLDEVERLRAENAQLRENLSFYEPIEEVDYTSK